MITSYTEYLLKKKRLEYLYEKLSKSDCSIPQIQELEYLEKVIEDYENKNFQILKPTFSEWCKYQFEHKSFFRAIWAILNY